MTLDEAAKTLECSVLAGSAEDLRREVRGGYVSDLLSDVMGNADDGCLWVTLQKHDNVVAVAHLKDLAAVVLVGGRRPEPQTLERASAEHVVILGTALSAWEAVGRLHRLGVCGRGNPRGT